MEQVAMGSSWTRILYSKLLINAMKPVVDVYMCLPEHIWLVP